uniref:Flavin-containing monooxygenase n=1 Tax=Saccoglossus kowalevskii TaxID=10224 RepID=A0ABM0M3A5_SACKO|nr:PREDICTED: dimethylaniline monooxygenase [N-oxide-forming] 5-like [Saccoglossus kowalevskii]
MSQRVAIIGAGVAGLLSIKCCLEEGLVPVCLERHDDLGGIWYYGDELRKGQVAATYDSVVTNISKEMLCFSDFPFPKEWPPFIPHKKVHQYLHSYAEHFGLKKYIRYNQDVLSIEESGDDGWNVVSMNSDGRVEEIFDHLMVCTGVYNKIHYPSYPGLDEFTGIQMHANQYRNTTGLTNKRIVVVAACITAGEISCELARTGSTEVYLSMRKGTWVIPRTGPDSYPYDMRTFSRSTMTGSTQTMESTLDKLVRQNIRDYKRLGLQNHEPILDTQSLMINDDIRRCNLCYWL